MRLRYFGLAGLITGPVLCAVIVFSRYRQNLAKISGVLYIPMPIRWESGFQIIQSFISRLEPEALPEWV